MKSVYRWVTKSNGGHCYIVKLDSSGNIVYTGDTGSYFYVGDPDLGSISNEVASWGEETYKENFELMSQELYETFGLRLYPYYYYYNIDKANVVMQYGYKGDKGDTGPQGDQGPQGEKGDKGDQGPQGDNGKDGKDAVAVSESYIEAYPANAYVASAETPSTPVGGGYDFNNNIYTLPTSPDGTVTWSKSSSIEKKTNEGVYFSCNTFYFNGSAEGDGWSIPFRIDGQNGEDSDTIEYIYRLDTKRFEDYDSASQKELEDRLKEHGEKYNKIKGAVPDFDDWKNHKQSLTEEYHYEQYTFRILYKYKYTLSDGTTGYTQYETDDTTIKYEELEEPFFSDWANICDGSSWGKDGLDGDSVNYIFTRTTKNEAPVNPTLKDYETDEDYQEDDWYPNAENAKDIPSEEGLPSKKGWINKDGVYFNRFWTDDAVEPDEKWKYQWVCIRKSKSKYVDGVKTKTWGEFSDPVSWNQYISTQEKGQGLNFLTYFDSDDELNDATDKTAKTLTYTKEGETTPIVHPLANGDMCVAEGYSYIWDGDSWVKGPLVSDTKGTFFHVKYAKNITNWATADAQDFAYTDGEDYVLTSEEVSEYGVEEILKDVDEYKWGYSSDGTAYYWEYDTDGKTKIYHQVTAVGESVVGAKYWGLAIDDSEADPIKPSAYTWAKFDGDDGFGNEFIYCRTKDEDPPDLPGYQINPSLSSVPTSNTTSTRYCYMGKSGVTNLLHYEVTNDSESEYQKSEFYVAIEKETSGYTLCTKTRTNREKVYWTDDPQGVTPDYKYEWQAYRKYKATAETDEQGNYIKKWGNFLGQVNEKGYAVGSLYANYNDNAFSGENAPMLYPAGTWSVESAYTRTVTATPYVVHKDKYYYLSIEYDEDDETKNTVKGADTEPGTTDGENYWTEITTYGAIMSKAVFAGSGKIGSAYFVGDYMISLTGIDTLHDSGETEEYKNFWPYDPFFRDNTPEYYHYSGYTYYNEKEEEVTVYFEEDVEDVKDLKTFIPNWFVNLYTGEMWMNHGLIEIDSSGFTMSNNDGDILMDVDSEGNTVINGDVFSRSDIIQNEYGFIRNFVWGSTNLNDTKYERLYHGFLDEETKEYTGGTGFDKDISLLIGTDSTKGKTDLYQIYRPEKNGVSFTTDMYLDMRNSNAIFVFRNLDDFLVPIYNYLNEENPTDSVTPFIIMPFFNILTNTTDNQETQAYYLKTPTRLGGSVHMLTYNDAVGMVGNKITLINESDNDIYVSTRGYFIDNTNDRNKVGYNGNVYMSSSTDKYWKMNLNNYCKIEKGRMLRMIFDYVNDDYLDGSTEKQFKSELFAWFPVKGEIETITEDDDGSQEESTTQEIKGEPSYFNDIDVENFNTSDGSDSIITIIK